MKESWSAGPQQGRQSTKVPEREARSIPWSGAIKMIGLSVEGVPPRALCRSSPAARGCLGPSDDTIVCVLHAVAISQPEACGKTYQISRGRPVHLRHASSPQSLYPEEHDARTARLYKTG